MSDLIMLGGLWLNESQSGEKYMSGRIGLGAKVLIFKNKNKKESGNDPDYYLMVAPWEIKKKDEEDNGEDNEIPF